VRQVSVSPYLLRRFLFFRPAALLDLPAIFERLLMYTTAVSAGIGLVNLTPAYRLDGSETLRYPPASVRGSTLLSFAWRIGDLQMNARLRLCTLSCLGEMVA
jgi:membrane-associated protease RseP (regulator of RpoE activity)